MKNADRKALLLGTALASTLLIATITTPTPASAIPCVQPASPNPISDTAINADITCVNTVARTGDGVDPDAIRLDTNPGGGGGYIYLNNSGLLTSPTRHGIYTTTNYDGDRIDIINSGDIDAARRGIFATTDGINSSLSITNYGAIGGIGIYRGISATTRDNDSALSITNTGDIDLDAAFGQAGLYARTYGDRSKITIVNSGALNAIGEGNGITTFTSGDDSHILIENVGAIDALDYGIRANTYGDNSRITIFNSGRINAIEDEGIQAYAYGFGSGIYITNSGDIFSGGEEGIHGTSDGASSPVTILNSGDIDADEDGIEADTEGPDSRILIRNSGNIDAELGINADTQDTNSRIIIFNSGDINAEEDGIEADTYGTNSPILIDNSGTIVSGDKGLNADTHDDNSNITIFNRGKITAGEEAIEADTEADNSAILIVNSGRLTSSIDGIRAFTFGDNSVIDVVNTGDIDASIHGIHAATLLFGSNSAITIKNSGKLTAGDVAILAESFSPGSPIEITNSGEATGTGEFGFGDGIAAVSFSVDSMIVINNSGSANGHGSYGVGIYTLSYGSSIRIENSGSVFGEYAGILSVGYTGTKIVNTGDISAGSDFAIGVYGAGAEILNSGRITGFVDLSEQDDTFINQAGGVFETKETSFFNGGSDLFRNEAGGTVQAATNASRSESSAFEGLQTFQNRGLISMVDGRPGDSFTISNTVGGTDLDFAASGNSTLAVDAFLGGPGNSSSDTFTIEGDVSGVTTVQVVNTNYGPGVFDPSGIRVVTATGATPNPNAFQLDQSIDTGFFNYDLFFTPTGSGFWELRSFPGGGAYLLPQLVTAAQDIWHQSSSTWFDRTADLRVLMAGGPAPTAYDPGGKSSSAAGPYPLTPAVWARGSGSWLDRDDTARTTAYGRDYTIDLDRDLQTIDFQVGVDLGKRDALTQGDALVFGLLGGFVHGDLDYDAIVRSFNFDGGQVGVYATYLNGGLFVDTLVNAHLYSLETSTLGFPSSLDANTVGLRTDTGYRFGSFSGGPFLEPLATIEVTWADIDGFSLGGNTVSFDDDANVGGA